MKVLESRALSEFSALMSIRRYFRRFAECENRVFFCMAGGPVLPSCHVAGGGRVTTRLWGSPRAMRGSVFSGIDSLRLRVRPVGWCQRHQRGSLPYAPISWLPRARAESQLIHASSMQIPCMIRRPPTKRGKKSGLRTFNNTPVTTSNDALVARIELLTL